MEDVSHNSLPLPLVDWLYLKVAIQFDPLYKNFSRQQEPNTAIESPAVSIPSTSSTAQEAAIASTMPQPLIEPSRIVPSRPPPPNVKPRRQQSLNFHRRLTCDDLVPTDIRLLDYYKEVGIVDRSIQRI